MTTMREGHGHRYITAGAPVEAANLRIRAELMEAIQARVRASGLSQSAMAARLGLTQPRVSDLLTGRVAKFSLDALVNIAAKVGLEPAIAVEEQDRAALGHWGRGLGPGATGPEQ